MEKVIYWVFTGFIIRGHFYSNNFCILGSKIKNPLCLNWTRPAVADGERSPSAVWLQARLSLYNLVFVHTSCTVGGVQAVVLGVQSYYSEFIGQLCSLAELWFFHPYFWFWVEPLHFLWFCSPWRSFSSSVVSRLDQFAWKKCNQRKTRLFKCGAEFNWKPLFIWTEATLFIDVLV